MRKHVSLGVLLCVLAGCASVCAAQDKTAGTMPPPKVLLVLREFIKPGHAGMIHEKTESAFVKAFRDAKWPTQYLAVDSVSGKPRSLFLVGYDSFEAWEKDAQAVDKHPTLGATLSKASLADGEVQSDADGGIFVYREDMSLRANVAIAKMRYFEISVFVVKPGHGKDWEELAKLYMKGYEKIPDTRWATFQQAYGPWGDAYLVFVPMRSAKEIDTGFAQGKQFEDALGADGMQKLNELSAAAIESVQTNLFMFNPRESYVGEDWIKADPDFWAPKASTMKAVSKKAEKPAGQ